MYANLKKELFAKNITQYQLAKTLKVGENTMSKKMRGKTDFTLSEMFTIQKEFFPDLTLEYLFKQE